MPYGDISFTIKVGSIIKKYNSKGHYKSHPMK